MTLMPGVDLAGAPYAGAAGQKMGSALLKRYQAQTIRGSGGIANRAVSVSLLFCHVLTERGLLFVK